MSTYINTSMLAASATYAIESVSEATGLSSSGGLITLTAIGALTIGYAIYRNCYSQNQGLSKKTISQEDYYKQIQEEAKNEIAKTNDKLARVTQSFDNFNTHTAPLRRQDSFTTKIVKTRVIKKYQEYKRKNGSNLSKEQKYKFLKSLSMSERRALENHIAQKKLASSI